MMTKDLKESIKNIQQHFKILIKDGLFEDSMTDGVSITLKVDGCSFTFWLDHNSEEVEQFFGFGYPNLIDLDLDNEEKRIIFDVIKGKFDKDMKEKRIEELKEELKKLES